MGACNWQRELTSMTEACLCDLVVCGCPRSPSLFSLGSKKYVGVGLMTKVWSYPSLGTNKDKFSYLSLFTLC